MVIKQLNPGACRTYFIGSAPTKEAALIDPVLGHVDDYLKFLEDGGWTLRYVLDTHTHADHISGGVKLIERTDAEYAMHKKAGVRAVGRRLADGDSLRMGGVVMDVIETPGHTKDSVTVSLPGILLTGDWLFIGGAGRTDLPGGDPAEHWEISGEDLRRMIAEGGPPPLVLDVRQPEELVGPPGRLSGATFIPLGELQQRLSEISDRHEGPIVLVCRSGSRSIIAAAILIEAGFQNVSSMAGGMQAWRQRGYPDGRRGLPRE